MKRAHRIVIIVIIISCLHGIPTALFRNISPISNTCVNTNAVYAIYIPIYLLGLLFAIPISIMVVFGCLAYRNICLRRVLVERYIDRQVTRMTLVQVMLNVICLVPHGINNAYLSITSDIPKDANRLVNENFALSIFTLISYFYYAVCFFIHYQII